MFNEIVLNCENGWIKAVNIQPGMEEISFDASIKGSWFSATVFVSISVGRLKSFNEALSGLIAFSESQAGMISENGNFDIELSLDKTTGKVLLVANICPNMVDDDSIEFGLRCDISSVESFKNDLVRLLSRHKEAEL